MILVTGAAGKTGLAIIAALRGTGRKVRAFVRNPAQIPAVKSLGAAEVLVGDLRSIHDLQDAVRGIQAIYHIPPNMHPDEIALGKAVLEAAKFGNVHTVVYHSVLHPQTQKMVHHWNKMLVEEMLFETGLGWTILQPAVYMQNMLASWSTIVEEGIYRVPYPPETRLSLVDLADVAAIAARALTDEALRYGIYELSGTRALSQTEIAETTGRVLGREIRAEEIPLEEWRRKALQARTLSPYAVETLSAMFQYYAEYGLPGSPAVLTALLGREPTTLEAFLEKQRQV